MWRSYRAWPLGLCLSARRAPAAWRAPWPKLRRHRLTQHRHRDDAIDDPGDVVEIAQPFRQFGQPLAVADGLVRHRQRKMQPPVQIDFIAFGSERRIAAANFRRWSISRFLMRRIGGTDSIEARIMNRAAPSARGRGRGSRARSARPARAGWRRCRRARRLRLPPTSAD